MKVYLLPAIILSVAVLAGSTLLANVLKEGGERYESNGSGRFVLTGAGSGAACKIDSHTGEVWLVTPSFQKSVPVKPAR